MTGFRTFPYRRIRREKRSTESRQRLAPAAGQSA